MDDLDAEKKLAMDLESVTFDDDWVSVKIIINKQIHLGMMETYIYLVFCDSNTIVIVSYCVKNQTIYDTTNICLENGGASTM